MTAPSFDLSGKVAIVTGASRGIGAAIAGAYAVHGAAVVLTARKQPDLDAVANEIRQAGGQALAIAAHNGDGEAIAAAVSAAVETFGGVDILVNNAATNPHYGPLLKADDGVWDKIVDVNVKGYVRWIRACVPAMRARGGGKVINLASILGYKPGPYMGVYSVTKAAVRMLTEVLGTELADDNIQINAIAPGFIKTRFSAGLWEDEQREAALAARIPQRRIAEPEELTGIAVYLAAPASSFTTGATFLIDGGQLAGSMAL